jgi:CheY-like chemotaxis protein
MARKSILAVDDEKSQREILEPILSGEGCAAKIEI